METEQVILVDENDVAVGLTDKMTAHRRGLLHRAVSVFIFNSAGQLLLQKRATTKYHGAGLWTNTCCTHPRSDESPEEAAHRRLEEEMGFDCNLEKKFTFVYRSIVESGLTEHEYDHVFFGVHDGECRPDPNEAEDSTFATVVSIANRLEAHPEKYTVWFRIILKEYREHFTEMEHRLQKALGAR